MKILIVASYHQNGFAPFVLEQANALESKGHQVDFFAVHGGGVKGYLRQLSLLRQRIKAFRPAVIHAHYGLSGLLANLQRMVPTVTTYHGSDLDDPKARPYSMMAVRLSAWNVFVSQKMIEKVKPKRRFSLLPCGVDLVDSQMVEKKQARQGLGLLPDGKYVLFAGAFDNPVKNYDLAQKVIQKTMDGRVEVLELKGYSREEVNRLMSAVDALLMTSQREGSPQVIKEAMACGCPIVSVDVGDVGERLKGLEGCYVSQTRDPDTLALLLEKAMAFEGKTKGRERIVQDALDNRQVAEELTIIYQRVQKKYR